MKGSDIILRIDNTIGIDNTLKLVSACKKDDVTRTNLSVSINEYITEQPNLKLAEKAVSGSDQQDDADNIVIKFENHFYVSHIQEAHFSLKHSDSQQEKISNLFCLPSQLHSRLFTHRASLDASKRGLIANWSLQIYYKLLQLARNAYITACCLFSLLLNALAAGASQSRTRLLVLQRPVAFYLLRSSSRTKEEIRIQASSLRHGPPLFSLTF